MILTNEILTLTIDDGDITIYHSRNLAELYSPDAMLVFDPTAIEGFDDSPEVKRNVTARPISHGDFRAQGFYEGRIVSITGHAITKRPEDLIKLRHQFVGAINDGLDHTIAISKASQTLYMQMSQGSRIQWVQQLDNFAQWKVDLYAPDPRLYGAPKTAQAMSQTHENFALQFPLVYPLDFGENKAIGTTVLSNSGNSPSYPVYTVNADLPSGFSIQNGGKSIIFGGASFYGSPVVIDTYTGTATVNGNDRSYQLTKRDWISVPPLGTIPVDFAPLGGLESAAFADISYRDTWV